MCKNQLLCEIYEFGGTGVWASIYYKDSLPLQSDHTLCKSNCSTDANVDVWYELSGPVSIKALELVFISSDTHGRLLFHKIGGCVRTRMERPLLLSNTPGLQKSLKL
ncbi:hypothetical protein V9T40_005711 [Parthenolecanium corni]|uniref:Uncharacterized protein n=1 Tax=Parthenolecanium corni TaxID=536013 RepID=A0AAN9TX48_9HEMI